jgi:hypothetical protein
MAARRPWVAITGLLLDGGISHWVRVTGTGRSEIPRVVVHGGPGTSAYSLSQSVPGGSSAWSLPVKFFGGL